MASRIVAPLTGSVSVTSFTNADYTVPGVSLPSGKPFHYEIMMPSQYSTSFLWPLIIYLHPDTAGDPWYKGTTSSKLSGVYGGPIYQNVAFQTNYPSIAIVPYADQTVGGTTNADSAIENWGGWINTGATGDGANFNGETGPNVFALNGLVQHLIATLSIDPSRIYIQGFSLGGIGAEYFMLRYNQVNGNPKIYTAGTSTGGVLEIHGSGAGPSTADVTTMTNVPVWWISGQSDGNSPPTHWNTIMWQRLAGNTIYPAYQASEPASRAGTSQMHFWYVAGVGHSGTDNSGNWMEGNTIVLNWLFAQQGSATGTVTRANAATATFFDDFNSLDISNTGSATQWMDHFSFGGSEFFLGNVSEIEYMCGPPRTSFNPFSVANSILTIKVQSAASSGFTNPSNQPWNSGCITSCVETNQEPKPGLFASQFGYFEMRCQVPVGGPQNGGPGWWPAFVLYPLQAADGSNPPGEIDIFEWLGGSTGIIRQSLHSSIAASRHEYDYAPPGFYSTPGFHTVGADVQSDFITFYVDGVQTAKQATPSDYVGNIWYMNCPLSVGSAPSWANAPVPTTTPDPAFWLIDYIGVWPNFAAAYAVGGTGTFQISGGQIIDPNGKVYLAAGVNIYEEILPSAVTNAACQPLTTLFPGINQVRVVFRNSWDTLTATINAINLLTAQKIVVVLDDHVLGNSAPTATGATLSQELAWFTSMATTFKNNPYVWYQTQNEPGNGTNLAVLAQHEVDTYNAVRNTGNTSIVVMEVPSGGNKQLVGTGATGYDGLGPMTPSAYASMRNIIWDMHFYDFITVPAYSADIPTIKAALLGSVAGAYGTSAVQSVRSADGLVPVIIGEFGPSTSVIGGIDAGATNLVDVVMNSGFGFSAFTWYPGFASDNNITTTASGSLTSYGQQVASGIAAAAARRGTTATPSPNNTVVLAGSSALITDSTGATWGIVGAQVSRNGTVDTTTSSVTQLAYVNAVVWQKNTFGNWYSYVNGAWAGPTTTSPLPAASASGSFIVAPTTAVLIDSNFNSWGISTAGALTENGNQIATPGSIVVLTPTSGGSVTDSANHVWTLTSAGALVEDGKGISGGTGTGAVTVFNGTMYAQDAASKSWFTWNGTTFVAAATPPTTSLAIVEIAYVNNLIWEKDATNNWYSTPTTSAPVWTGPTTNSPLSASPGGISYILPMSQAGLRVISYIKQETPASFSTGLSSLRTEQAAHHDIFAYEGCQEPDTANFVGTPETLASAASFQQTVWSAGQADGLPVIQTSFGVTADYGTTGNLAAFATYGNAHCYTGTLNSAPNDGPAPGFISTLTTAAKVTSPGLPVAHTEFGWRTDHNSAAAITAYVLDFIMSGYFDFNLPYYIVQGLYDDASGNWGIYNADQTPRPVATALSNFFTLLKDTSASALSFGPGLLNVSFSNLPIGSNPTMGGHFGVLQKADGSFWILLRNEQTLTTSDANNHTPITVASVSVTMTLATLATSIAVYDVTTGTAPIQTAGNTSSLTISLPPYPLLIKIVRP